VEQVQYFSVFVLSKTLNLATFLTVIWLLWTSTGQQHHVQKLSQQQSQANREWQRSLSDTAATIRSENSAEILQVAAARPASTGSADQEARISALTDEISGYQQRIAGIERSAELKLTLNQILQAEFNKVADPQSAAEQLLATKEAIWRKSTEEEMLTQSLQSLMAPIDILADSWQQGYTENSVATIYRVIADSINQLEQDGRGR